MCVCVDTCTRVYGYENAGGLGDGFADVARIHAVVKAEQTQGPTAACV